MAHVVPNVPSHLCRRTTLTGKGASLSRRERAAAERPGEGLRAGLFSHERSPHPTRLRRATFSLWEKESRAGFPFHLYDLHKAGR
jgi:hypothetical protein